MPTGWAALWSFSEVIGNSAVALTFFTGPEWLTRTGTAQEGRFIDGDPQTWETVSMEGLLPAATRWVVAEVMFINASIGASPGYADEVNLSISVPEPATALMLGTGVLLALRRRGARRPA